MAKEIKNRCINIMKKIIKRIIKLFHEEYSLLKNGIIYVSCIFLILHISKKLIEYPLLIAYKYNIELDGENYINLYSSYKYIFLGTLIIAVGAIPFVKLINRIKRVSKNGIECNEEQNTENNLYKKEIPKEAIQNLIESNDTNNFDEKSEEEMYNSILKNRNDEVNLLKYKSIKTRMKPLTALIAMELYNHSKNNIYIEIVIEYIKQKSNRNKKRMNDRNREIAENIINFLVNNDLIEADDIEEGKYYFTPFGNSFMNYFSNGII